ncbi:uncharacterized protein LOC110669952 isoform X2 [Hevea brasiliensis]|uniref:uncharacterized protein LOC110669952 isoform X2 n=1 Tax=Hevea brasiliensis TaxID=3981 RepID=UPI0025F91C57|nr:uncharacterized protein LOC110669952 isoform X2 [Hevea brasiliensis]
MAVDNVFDGNIDISSSSVSELISSLKSAFRRSQFSDVETVLGLRQQKLKCEIKVKAKDEQLEKQNGLLELERLEKIRIENELESCSRECIELRELNSRLSQELNDLNERLQADVVHKQTIIELTRKNIELESAKLKAETEAEIYKRIFDELLKSVEPLDYTNARVSREFLGGKVIIENEKSGEKLNTMKIGLDKIENAHYRVGDSPNCLVPEDGDRDLKITEEKKRTTIREVESRLNVGKTSEKLVQNEVHVIDCDENVLLETNACLNCNSIEHGDGDMDTAEMAITTHVGHAHSGQTVARHGTGALKRKRASSVIEGGNDNNQDVDDNCTTDKLKMTKTQKIIHMLNISPAMNYSAASLSFGTNNSAREFIPSKPAVLLQCEEKMASDNKSQDGSDSLSSSSSEDEWDFSVDFSTMNKNWQGGQANGAHKGWELDSDMVTTFEKDGTSASQNRGFDKLAVTRIRGFGSSQGSTFGRGHSEHGRGYGREIASDSDTAPSTEVDAGSQGEPCTAAEHFALSPSTLCFPPAIDISSSHDAADATAVAMGSVASSSAAPAGRLSSAPAASVDARSIFGSNDRPHITLDGNKLHPSDVCARKITSIFREKLDEDGYCWKNVSKETKDFYWQEFQKCFMWDEVVSTLVKTAWQRKAAERYRALMHKIRKGKERSIHLSDATWNKWNEAWSTPEFKTRCEQFSANRRSETGGPGSGISRHTGGSISHTRHNERMRSKLGREPLPHELFKETHTRKGTSEFIDARSQAIYDRYLTLKEEMSQPQKELDETQLYYKAVGGVKKQRVYGVGSQASAFYPQSYHASKAESSCI